MLSVKTVSLSLACVFVVHSAWADPAQPIDPERLKALLPAAWAGMERRNVQAERQNMGGFKSSTAEAYYKANGSGGLELVVRLSDGGESSAKMYAYGADYLKKDVKNETQKSLAQGGRRFLLTSATAKSMLIETQVGGRWVVNVNCINATEVQCVESLGKVDYAGLEKLKP